MSLPRAWPGYRTLWRWHFYAGLFCIPFILWLSVTGAIYLFKPQIERWLDAPHAHLGLSGPPASASAQVAAALAAVPGGRLNGYQLPAGADAAAQVLVGRDAELMRVTIHPQTRAVLDVAREDLRPMRLLFRLHGELLAGTPGSMLVELAASWTLVMLITGIYLWWPRQAEGLAGVLYPRLDARRRVVWRDLHAVVALWVSAFTLFLLVSGLPWAKSWGGMLKDLRSLATASAVQQDWTTGSASERAERRLQNSPPGDEHAAHRHGGVPGHGDMAAPAAAPDYAALDRIVPTVAALDLPAPVIVSPPSRRTPDWTARSDTQNRPQRVTLRLDPASGALLSRQNFADRPLLDRVIGTAVAAHEGQLFGAANQALGVFTAAGLVLVSISSVVLWWGRRAPGTLGAPAAAARGPLPWWLLGLMALLGLLLPLLGASMLAIAAFEVARSRLRPG